MLFCFRKGQRWQDIWFFLCESHASRRNNNPRRRSWAVCIQGGLFKAFVIMFLLWLLFISLPGSLNLSYPCVKSGLISQNWGTRKFSPKMVMNRRWLERNLRESYEKAFGGTWEEGKKGEKSCLVTHAPFPPPDPQATLGTWRSDDATATRMSRSNRFNKKNGKTTTFCITLFYTFRYRFSTTTVWKCLI